MAKTSKAKAIKTTKALAAKYGSVVDSNISNYEARPFFVNKANKARELIKRVGLPGVFRKDQ